MVCCFTSCVMGQKKWLGIAAPVPPAGLLLHAPATAAAP